MKIANKYSKDRKLTLFIALTVAVAIIGGCLLFAFLKKSWPFAQQTQTSTIDFGRPSEEQRQAGNDTKQQSVVDTPKNTGVDQPTVSNQTGNKPNATLSITSTNTSNGILYIRTLIGTTISSGGCRLSMDGPQSKTYTATADIQSLATNSTCKGFNVPISALSPGTWKIAIVLDSSEYEGSVSKTIEVSP